MAERRKHERRKWGRKVTYPFIDSDGVLVTKNRRRLVDRRSAKDETKVDESDTTNDTSLDNINSSKSSIDISESKVMELEEAIKDDTQEPASKIEDSIKSLESEILTSVDKPKKASQVKNNPVQQNKAKSTEKESELKLEPLSANGADDQNTSIELHFNGDKHVLSSEQSSYKVGRDPACDIIVQGKYVSRMHAKIVYKEGKFLLQDDSFNGTYIKFKNGQKIHVTKNEQTLISDGVMSMGEPVKDEKKSIIQFKILE